MHMIIWWSLLLNFSFFLLPCFYHRLVPPSPFLMCRCHHQCHLVLLVPKSLTSDKFPIDQTFLENFSHKDKKIEDEPYLVANHYPHNKSVDPRQIHVVGVSLVEVDNEVIVVTNWRRVQKLRKWCQRKPECLDLCNMWTNGYELFKSLHWLMHFSLVHTNLDNLPTYFHFGILPLLFYCKFQLTILSSFLPFVFNGFSIVIAVFRYQLWPFTTA